MQPALIRWEGKAGVRVGWTVGLISSLHGIPRPPPCGGITSLERYIAYSQTRWKVYM